MKHHAQLQRDDGAVLLLSLILLTLLALMLASAFRASAFTASAARWMLQEQRAFSTAHNALDAALSRSSLPAGDAVQLPLVQPTPNLQLTLHCDYLGRRDDVVRAHDNGTTRVNLAYAQLTARVRASDGVEQTQQLIIAIVLPSNYTDGDALPLARDATRVDQAGAVSLVAWRSPRGQP
ncbi:MAG: hypothetical protein AAFO81_10065 [Pseudomonadota bacterium]